jgi:carbamate kinase
MRIVIALGGNALLQRGQPMTAENQRANIRVAAECIARFVPGNEVVIAHGNGPQVGLLALQAAAYLDVAPYPLDVLGAQTEAMIGYVIEQELGNLVPFETPLATLLTMIEVDAHDPAFDHPTKPIGPVYDRATAERRAREDGWVIAPDGDGFRRVVASPEPRRIFELRPIRQLLERGTVVVCAGGGGIPTVYDADGHLHGIEAVIDKDLASGLLAKDLEADLLVIATDVDGVYTDWGTPEQRRLDRVTPDELEPLSLPAGSMGPKVRAACRFARETGHDAVIGSLADIVELVAGTGGTRVSLEATTAHDLGPYCGRR